MTISKERLNVIALELGDQFGEFKYGDAQGAVTKSFAHALLKRIEQEHKNTHHTLFIALPLVED